MSPDLTLFFDLLVRYFTEGFFFFLAHLLLALLIVFDSWLRQIRPEISALESWRPSGLGDEDDRLSGERILAAESTRILDRFVAECKELGSKAFFVPMTDYSDRLDSIVEGRLTDLYNRTNLFLIVGIGGSLFGLFKFAVGADFAADAGFQSISDLLTSSMAKAFPVAFVGLLLTLVSQILIAYPERWLRKALASSIELALEVRERTSRSQAAVVERAALSIGEAMKPLENLQGTLEQSIKPVISEFSRQMNVSLKFYESQFQDLTGATGKVIEAVEAVKENIRVLQLASQQLETTLQAAPRVLQNTIRLQEDQENTFQRFAEITEAAFERLQSSLERLDKRFEGVISSYSAALQSTEIGLNEQSRRTLETLQEEARQLFTNAEEHVSRLLESAAAEFERLRGASLEMAETLKQQMTTAAGALLQLRDLGPELSAAITGEFRKVGQQSLNHLQVISSKVSENMSKSLMEQHERLAATVERQYEGIGSTLGAAGKTIKDLAEAQSETAQSANRLLVEIETQAEEMLTTISTTVDTRVSESVDLFWEDLQSKFDKLSARLEETAKHVERRALKAARSFERFEELPAVMSQGAEQTFSDLRDRSLELARVALRSLSEGVSFQSNQLTEVAQQSLDGSRQVVAELETSARGIQKDVSDLVDRIDERTQRLLEDTIKGWQKASKDFATNLDTATSALKKLEAMPEVSTKKLDLALAGVRQNSTAFLEEISRSFFNTIQQRVLLRLVDLEKDAKEVRKQLGDAAEAWHKASYETVTAMRDPITEAVGEAKKEILEMVRALDEGLVKRYPAVLEDIDRLSRGLSSLLSQLDDVRGSFNASIEEARTLRREMRVHTTVATAASIEEVAEPQLAEASDTEASDTRWKPTYWWQRFRRR